MEQLSLNQMSPGMNKVVVVILISCQDFWKLDIGNTFKNHIYFWHEVSGANSNDYTRLTHGWAL